MILDNGKPEVLKGENNTGEKSHKIIKYFL
jgi:hypothetical protein